MISKHEEIIWEVCEELGMPYDDYVGEPTMVGEIRRLKRCERELDTLKRMMYDDGK